ncbi:S-layer homology domain-containing protein [Paenibacillus sp. PR3]|uniref:S-layer homology domain-containing protein n=1 Tax=Paenibacillus terricola TaxID=2763503 RepID=A0ABR8N2G8_9BACL|nr:S-layer homology domain-containing protein [Paenibacillus terricola]MBD3920659.1 S-layer homology domain-containing protein [Paenibacillus terricola]
MSRPITINAGDVKYVIPAEQIGISAVAAKLGVPTSSLRSIEVEIRLIDTAPSIAAQINEKAKTQGYELLLPPVEFEIVARTTSASGVVSEVSINEFTQYVSRIMQLPAGIDGNKITTGIVYNADGTLSHIPTVVYEEDSMWYAKLNSLTNSIYSVIWNPIEVASAAKHWSKAAVNDMASRLIVKKPEQFVPDASITRGDFAEYITKALGLYRTGVAKNGLYSDVLKSDSRADAISIATAYGIITGYPDGTFRPDALITRQEAMVMYARAMNLIGLAASKTDKLAGYKDLNKVAAWAYKEVEQTVEAGVFSGRTATTIDPRGVFTYAEAATAVRNLLQQAELINNQ